MDDFKPTSELRIRLLGYYLNETEQVLETETVYPEQANELGELLAQSFAEVNDLNHDAQFAEALENGVFVLRDEQSHLYAYWPKGQVARVSGVTYDKEKIHVLGLEYKEWFTPGEDIKIIPKTLADVNAARSQSFYEYLVSQKYLNTDVTLYSDGMPEGKVTGQLVAIGRDFIKIKEYGSPYDFLATRHMCLQVESKARVRGNNGIAMPSTFIDIDEDESDDDPWIRGNGNVVKWDSKTNWGEIKPLDGTEPVSFDIKHFYSPQKGNGYRQKTPRVKESVIFFRRIISNETGTKNMANLVFLPGRLSDCLNLAKSLYYREGNRTQKNWNRSLSTSILEYVSLMYPNSIDVESVKEGWRNDVSESPVKDSFTIAFSSSQQRYQDISQKYKEMSRKYKDEENMDQVERTALEDQLQETINEVESLMTQAKQESLSTRMKDCVSLLVKCYMLRYEMEDDEETKNIFRGLLREFILDNQTRMARNFLFNNLTALACFDDEYFLIDSALQKPEISRNEKATLLYFKSTVLIKEAELAELNEDQAKRGSKNAAAIKCAKESLSLNPFNNKAELYLFDSSPSENTALPSRPAGEMGKCMSAILGGVMIDLEQRKNIPAFDDFPNGYLISARQSDGEQTKCYMAEYASAMACKLYADKDHVDKRLALHLWREVFQLVPGFGYFVQNCLGKMLSAILAVSDEDNRNVPKPWKDVLYSSVDITEEQWREILFAVDSDDVREKVAEVVNKQFKESFSNLFGCDDVSEIAKRIDDEWNRSTAVDMVMESVQNTVRGNGKLYDKLNALSTVTVEGLTTDEAELLDIINNECIPHFQQYLQDTKLKGRLQNEENVVDLFNQIFEKIYTLPTWFMVTGLLPVVTYFRDALLSIQGRIHATQQPEFSLEILTPNIAPDDEGFYPIQLKAFNAKNSFDALNVHFTLKSKFVKEFQNGENDVTFQIVKTGMYVTLCYRVRLLEKCVKEGSWSFAVECSYSTDGITQDRKLFTPLHVHLLERKRVPFIKISDNPYHPGGVIRSTDPTFVGRCRDKEEIKDTILSSTNDGPQLILYGQKRCGKTSLLRVVTELLKTDYQDQAWCISISLGAIDKKFTLADFYQLILSTIRTGLDGITDDHKPATQFYTMKELNDSGSPFELFCESISKLKSSMKETPGWEGKRLVVVIDEFTNMYNAINAGAEDLKSFFAQWKTIQENAETNFATVFIGHDVAPTFLNESYAVNGSTIIQRKQLTYLDYEEASQLITEPTKIEGKSRFSEKAVEKIYYYTSGNPWLLQHFMKRMVVYINKFHIEKVVQDDVKEVADQFITLRVEGFRDISGFDFLYSTGLFDEEKDRKTINVLRAIAKKSDGQEWCVCDDVVSYFSELDDMDTINSLPEMLDDLFARIVIDRKENNQYMKIVSGLFKEWLIRN